MPFIPHTEPDIRAMLASIGARSVENLFDEIPAALKTGELGAVPDGMNEMQVARLMNERAAQDATPLNFIGAGAYEHHIPAAVWQIVSRGEFYTAYTPYQAEASQGTLQVLYEYQTMMASLTGMDVSNGSLYDGASGLAEAVLMAVRSHKTSRKVLIPATVSPIYRSVVQSIVKLQGIELEEIPFCTEAGNTVAASLDCRMARGDVAAVVIPQPDFFGVLEEVDALTDKVHAYGALAIALVNPLALALLKAPGQWGTKGADIAVGEGQPLGIPLSNGGPYFGFLCCKQALVRQMPGRIVGRTVDLDGKQGFTLTLQAREQHIRRAKATSNICSNQGLMVTAATIHIALLGGDGLRRAAAASHANTLALVALAEGLRGVKRLFTGPYFHEVVLQLPAPPEQVLAKMRAQGVLGGLDLSAHYPQLGNAILVCATETKTANDLQHYVDTLKLSLTNQEN